MSKRLPTGITVLDRQLDGGLPAGSIVFLGARPASQSELILYELTAARGTLYLTTARSVEAVRDALDRSSVQTGNPTVRDVDGDGPVDQAHRLIRGLPDEANLIIDIVDVLERVEPSRYRMFLNEVQTHMINTGGVTVLHGMKTDATPANRGLTEHMADIVFDLETNVKGSEIENRLAIPKFRGGRALDETIKLRLTEEVDVDTSRDIA
ncbi:transcriptional regulator [Salinigranum rubrum]|uniref:Transcriptional regulator n=1 Tax=Salinigranum rubrum TaxID=755307 RepID=A0A2I8VJ53_9EURY|nr:transcriptional regulator [Salinigranum rubrum]AUV81967.1 transcriptional regulator [Salinigranum rubrum]